MKNTIMSITLIAIAAMLNSGQGIKGQESSVPGNKTIGLCQNLEDYSGTVPEKLRRLYCKKCASTFAGKSATFRRYCPQEDKQGNTIMNELKKLKVDDKASYLYILTTQITPGQLRYSRLNVEEKKKAAFDKGAAVKEADGSIHFKYDNNKSIISPEEPAPVVLAPFGPVLVDQHHETRANIELGGTTIPVYVKKDLSTLSIDDFWKQATKEGLVYPYTLENQYKIPSSFQELKNDPNRFFAALVARKCNKSGDPASETFGSPKTPLADYPVWIKVGKDIPFIEFKISDLLNSQGIMYNESWAAQVPDEFVEKARKALVEHPIAGLKVIPQRVKYDEIPNICIKESLAQ